MGQQYDTIPTGEKSKAERLAELLLNYTQNEMGAVRTINHNRGNYLQMIKTEPVPEDPDQDQWGAVILMCDGSMISVTWSQGSLQTKWSMIKRLQPGEGIQ